MEKAVVYIVAGMSSRFGGKIKQLAEVGENNKTFIEVSMDQAIGAGFNRIVFVVGKKTASAFQDKFGDSYRSVPIKYAFQNYNEQERDKPWGTTDALCSAIDVIKTPFVVCNGDDLYGEKSFKILAEHLESSTEAAAIGYRLGSVLPETGETNRGIFQANNGYTSEIKEAFGVSANNLQEKKLTEESLCSMNLFALHPETLSHLNEKLDKFKSENKGHKTLEALLPQHLSELIKENKIKMKLHPTEDSWIGITNPGDELDVREFLRSNS